VGDVADYYNLHPGLRALLLEGKHRNMTDAEVTEAYKNFSDRCEKFDLESALNTNLNPVAPKNVELVVKDVIAVAFGQANL
jgi:hypothetical protein